MHLYINCLALARSVLLWSFRVLLDLAPGCVLQDPLGARIVKSGPRRIMIMQQEAKRPSRRSSITSQSRRGITKAAAYHISDHCAIGLLHHQVASINVRPWVPTAL